MDDSFVTRCTDDQGAKLRIPAAELQESCELVEIEAACLHFHGPVTPIALEDRVNLKRLFTPVSHPLTLVDGECQASVFHPQTKPSRLTGGVRGPIPEARKRGIRFIACGVDCVVAELGSTSQPLKGPSLPGAILAVEVGQPPPNRYRQSVRPRNMIRTQES